MILRADSRDAVDSAVGVVLLEALRSTDTPPETLEAEDFTQSLPRRLGLSGVIERQIERYTRLEEEGRGLEPSAAEDLFRLISRREDARDVFRRAGRELARRGLRSRGIGAKALSWAGPRFLTRWLALRAAARLARRVSPGGSVRTERDPPSLVVEGCLPARACEGPDGCDLLSQGLETFLGAYAGSEVPVVHPMCESAAEPACVFRLASRSREADRSGDSDRPEG